MSKKNIISEGAIRRFMKLANMAPLSETFVDRIREEELPEEDPMAAEEPMPEEEPVEEPLEGGGEMDPVDLVSDITSAIVQHFQDKGVDLSIDVAEEDAAVAPEEAPAEEPALDEPVPEEEPAPEEELMEEDDIDGMLEQAGVTLQELDDDLINEVTLRVAKRLIEATKKK